jgi:hypothetical protein
VSLSSSHEKFLLWTWASMLSPLCRARAVQINILLLQARRYSYAELRSSSWLDPCPIGHRALFPPHPKAQTNPRDRDSTPRYLVSSIQDECIAHAPQITPHYHLSWISLVFKPPRFSWFLYSKICWFFDGATKYILNLISLFPHLESCYKLDLMKEVTQVSHLMIHENPLESLR